MIAQEVLEGSRRWVVINGKAERVLKKLPNDSIHAAIMDPPSSIKFMGKEWDSDKGGRTQWVAWLAGILQESFRVTRPGGWAAVWALPRRAHWTACAVEDAGWEIRDRFHHLFSTGMPKGFLKDDGWKEWGTGLKPVVEHWILARKPLSESSTAGNLERWGTGALHVDACRVGSNAGWNYPKGKGGSPLHGGGFKNIACKATKGRYPPHLVLSHAGLCIQVGTQKVKTGKAHRSKGGGLNFGSEKKKPPLKDMTYGDADGLEEIPVWACVSGCAVRAIEEQSPGASRFWPVFQHCPKAGPKEKNAGCDDLDPKDWREGTKNSTPRSGQLYEHVGRKGKDRPNNHPTVKPVKFMQWLVRLLCIEDGIVLDPFNGSGTTGVACVLEGMRYIGIEMDKYFCVVSGKRIGVESQDGDVKKQHPPPPPPRRKPPPPPPPPPPRK